MVSKNDQDFDTFIKILAVGVVLFFLNALLECSAKADPEVNEAAHIGTSFTISTTLYGVNKNFFETKAEARTVSAFETILIGVLYKGRESFPNNTGAAMAENAVGVGLSVGVCYVFEF